MLWSLVFALFLASGSGLNLPGVPTSFTDNDGVLSAISDDVAKKFAKEFLAYQKTGIESAALRQISKQLASSHSKKDIFTKSAEELGAADQFFMCTTCRATVRIFTRMFAVPEGTPTDPNRDEEAKKAMLQVCAYLEIETPEVCAGLFDLNWKIADYIMQNSVADSRSMCGSLPITFCKVRQDEFDWSLKIDENKPSTAKTPEATKKSPEDLKVIQLTDIHYDDAYQPGALAECDEPLCCRRTTTEVTKQAGYWSDYRSCDSPWHMIEDALDHINRTHETVEAIYQTGDLIPHNVWSTKQENNMKLITEINDLLVEKFPGVKIYPCVGNHEAHPTNVFAPENVPEELDVKWLYEHLFNMWAKWLPANTKDTIMKGGYYTALHKPGFRIISLNNNYGYLWNWFVYLDGRIAIEQLQWFHDTLLAAEKAGEHVHVLVHIPSGDADCWTVWAREYNRILERFDHIITGIFTGHTHKDELNVHYNKSGQPFGVTWNGGSLTSYSNKNPNYKVYDIDPTTKQVVDFETWIFNLTLANLNGAGTKPHWHKEYTFTEAFTDDLSPMGMHKLLEKMAEHPDLLHQYWQYKFTSGDPYLHKGCDNKCLLRTICPLATSVYDQKDTCRHLQEKLTQNLTPETTENPGTTDSTTGGTTEKPGGDGAVTISAVKITTLIGLLGLVKIFF